MKYTVNIISFLFLFLCYCNQPEQKFHKSELISEKDLVPVLIDLHLANGLLGSATVRNEFANMDSLEHYLLILENYGYSLNQFNNTIEYYSHDPETLDDIYEKVIAQLSKMEVGIFSSYEEKGTSVPNLWEGKTTWNLPEDGKQNKLEFEVPVKYPGIYKIIADIKIYPDDESLEPAITAYFWYDNQTETGDRLFFPKTRISKSGKKRTYRITQKILSTKITHLRGYLLDHSPKPGDWKKHISVTNFSIEFEPIAGPVK